ncbi:MAG: hypothetical protein RID07_17405, partial [Lacipirellulaceae bacterium]
TGQGVALAITADTGAAEDYMPHYGGVGYRFRAGLGANTSGDGSNFRSGQADNPDLRTGLVGDVINEAWQGEAAAVGTFDFGTGVPENELNQFSGDSLYFSPDPTDSGSFLSDGSGVDRSYFAEAFPTHDDPLVVTANLASPQELLPNSFGTAGVVYNRWATHRAYYIDGVVTFTVEDSVAGVEVVIMEKEINDPSDPGADTVFDDTSDAGSVVLGFWDRFGGSIALSPEGANFAIYDNLSVTAASSGDAPTLAAAIAGFLPGATGDNGDENGDLFVDGTDFLLLQQADADLTAWGTNYGSSVATVASGAVPEPTSALLMTSLLLGLLAPRRASQRS